MSLTLSLIAGGLVGWLIARLLPGGGDAPSSILLGVLGAGAGAWLAGVLGVRVFIRLDMLAAGVVGAALLVLAVRAARR
jgi:uncharacterized membrane protein YeaQ/YmgE (transglycosylase-associated protein family)